MGNIIAKWSCRCPWKAFIWVFQIVSGTTRFVVVDKVRILFWEDLWWGNQPLCSQFSCLYRIVTVKNFTISTILTLFYFLEVLIFIATLWIQRLRIMKDLWHPSLVCNCLHLPQMQEHGH